MQRAKKTLGAIFLAAALSAIHPAGAQPPPSVWETYHDYERLTAELAELSQTHPHLFVYESIGSSEQDRDIWMVTITNRSLPPDRPEVFFDGAMHGSEVIASESMLYYVRFLVTQYDSDPIARQIVDNWITYVVPMVNPDGVERAKDSRDYRLARKNANRVDLNRNFDWIWTAECGPGCSAPCAPTCWEYPGPFAFSERESGIIRDQVANRRVLLYFSGHAGLSFEQLIRPGVFDDPAERQRHILVQCNVEQLAPEFRPTSGNQAGAAKNWAYGVPMAELRAEGLHPLAFNLEIYSIPAIEPGSLNPYWWCRYNPPATLDDEVAAWCIEGTGQAPTDTVASRLEKVRTALVFITQSTVTDPPPCPAK